jgi:hypothetical protein
VVAVVVEDAWGDVSLLIDDGVWDGLVDAVAGGGGGREKRQGGIRLVGVACAFGGDGGGVL